MEEVRLLKLWQTSDALSERQLSEMKSKVEQVNQRQSTNIMNQLMRNSLKEIFWGLAIALIASISCQLNILLLIIAISSVLASLFITVPSYLELRRKTTSINLQEVKSSLSDYIAFIENYVRRLRLTVFVFVPIVFTVGIIGIYLPNAELNERTTVVKILLTMLAAAPFVSGFLFFEFRKYTDSKYASQVIELKKIRDALE
jgi:hypothetical protein